jgi:hypothetical protein
MARSQRLSISAVAVAVGIAVVSAFTGAFASAWVPRIYSPKKELSYSVQEVRFPPGADSITLDLKIPTRRRPSFPGSTDSTLIYVVTATNSGTEPLGDVSILLQLQTTDSIATLRELVRRTSPVEEFGDIHTDPSPRGTLRYVIALLNPGDAFTVFVAGAPPVPLAVFSKKEGMRVVAQTEASTKPRLWRAWGGVAGTGVGLLGAFLCFLIFRRARPRARIYSEIP